MGLREDIDRGDQRRQAVEGAGAPPSPKSRRQTGRGASSTSSERRPKRCGQWDAAHGGRRAGTILYKGSAAGNPVSAPCPARTRSWSSSPGNRARARPEGASRLFARNGEAYAQTEPLDWQRLRSPRPERPSIAAGMKKAAEDRARIRRAMRRPARRARGGSRPMAAEHRGWPGAASAPPPGPGGWPAATRPVPAGSAGFAQLRDLRGGLPAHDGSENAPGSTGECPGAARAVEPLAAEDFEDHRGGGRARGDGGSLTGKLTKTSRRSSAKTRTRRRGPRRGRRGRAMTDLVGHRSERVEAR